MESTLKRRTFLKLSLSAGGALIAGVYVQSCTSKGRPASTHAFCPLIQIGTDGWVTLTSKNPEIGQGVQTALPMMLAEELGADWEKVRIVQADYDPKYEEQWAGGSYAITLNWDLMRTAGARVRQVLLEAAAVKMKLPVAELTTRNSTIVHLKSKEALPFEAVLTEAARLPLPEKVVFKPADTFEIVGKPLTQAGGPKLVRGAGVFCIDTTLPGMVYATVVKNPVFEGGPGSWDDSGSREVSGFIEAVGLNHAGYGGRLLGPNSPNFVNGVAVVATSTWAAFQAAEKLKVVWDTSGCRKENTEALFERFHAQLDDTSIERKDGNIQAARQNAASNYEAVYEVPFLAHVPMEPMNCTVDFRADRCEVWAPTQNPEALEEGLVNIFGLKPEQIKIHLPRIGGGFGRRYYADYAMDAAVISKKVGKPVKLTWTREADIRHDWYRPASVQKLSASLDANGMVTGWRHILANASRITSLGREGSPAGTEIDEYEFPAGFVPNLQLEYGHVLSDVPLGQWRAVGHSATAFAVHCFLDELAVLKKMDPIDYFLEFLGPVRMVPVVADYEFDLGRLLAVIHKVRKNSDWGRPLPPGQGMGFAAVRNSGSYVAEVVTVRADDSGKIRILRVDAVVDCGIVVNPSGAAAQVEGGILDGLCAALYGEITIRDGAAIQSNFHDYRWLRMNEVPEIHIEFLQSNSPPRGLGEPPLPPAAPALANAIYAATGRRIRKLPVLGPI